MNGRTSRPGVLLPSGKSVSGSPASSLAVIAFHSLEDRRVKEFIARESREMVDRRAPFAPPKAMRLQAVARIKPGDAEVAANPRARSAILRVAERTEAA